MILPAGWMAVTAAIAAIQVAAAVRLRLAARRLPPPLPSPAPPVSVIVPFKGAGPDLRANVAAFLALEYPGELEWVFVTAAPEDASLEILRAAARGEPRVKVVVSGVVPERAAEQPLNLLAGVAAARGEILAFADSDLGPAPGWLAKLARTLQEPGVVLATTAMVYRPQGGGLSSWMRLAWMSFGLPWFEALGWGTGQSLALRRRDFDALELRGLWDRTISHDLRGSARARAGGGRVRFVLDAAPDGTETCSWTGLASHMNRWMTVIRFNAPSLWWCGLAVTAIKLGAAAEAVHGPFCAPLLGVVLGGDLLYGLIVFDALAAANPKRADLRRGALLFPLLLPLLALNYAASAFYREIVWSGWTYRFDGPRAERGAQPARRLRRARAARLAAIVAAGAAAGLAYRGGPAGLAAWGVFAVLLGVVDGASWSRAFAWGALFGAVECAFATPWLYVGLRRFLGADPPEAAVWFVGLCLVQGLRWAVVAALAARARPGWARAAAFAAAGAAGELLLPGLLPAPLAMTQLFHLPTVQCAAPLGDIGPALLILSANAALFLLFRGAKGARTAAALVALALLGNEVWGRAETARVADAAARAPRLRIGVVQAGREPADARSIPDRVALKTARYAALTRAAAEHGPVDLVLWPESSYGRRLEYDLDAPQSATAAGRPVAAALAEEVPGSTPILINGVGRGADGLLRNVSLLASADRRPLGLSEKQILTPFGEYLPGGAAAGAFRAVSPLTGHLASGRARILRLGEARLGVMVCYEDIGFAPAQRLAALGADVLATQANDGWFDGTFVPEQHLMLDVLRAVETRRAIARAANTGVSAFVEPTGAVAASLPAGREGFLIGSVPLMEERTGGGRAEKWLCVLAAAAAVGLAAAGAAKPERL